MPTPSLWLAEPAPARPHQVLDEPAEVVVVGGGVTGCSAALTLARRGVRVRLVEAREIAGGASGRNGGFALRGAALAYDRARERLGRAPAAELWRRTEEALEEMASIAGDGLRRVGSLRIADDPAEREELEREFTALEEDGFDVEWRDDLDGSLAGTRFGAIYTPPDGALEPARWVRRLAAAAAEAGAEIREHTRLASLEDAPGATVLVATDGYPSGLLGGLGDLIRPTRGQVIATEPLGERLYPLPHYARHGYDYWHSDEAGRLVVGGFRDLDLEGECTAEEVTTPRIQAALEDSVEVLLGFRPAIEHRWAGIFGTVADQLPLVGPVPGREGVWVSAGYSGHGNVLGFLCGQLAARAILGERDPLLDLFEPGRRPLHSA